ncbi:hypothetical protein [Bradyrhizobium commune]|uniref:Uncharacterized protein n=1 Tax=Bradyrhizobium commune TaxID=83627 RepID=A0A7S9D333_9BRAD|nr:hypothetical protein [Bradyrhizobium commune]QPF90292.1 hypothetical protein IC761_27905 [Bradyrhizobium commune]
MNSVSNFRILLFALASTVFCYGVISGAAEIVVVARPDFTTNSTSSSPLRTTAAVKWLEAVAPLRSDLASNQILAVALQRIQEKDANPQGEDSGVNLLIKSTLAVKPYDADLWLARAILESRQDANGPDAAEALKMAYLTAPADAQLMPFRLDTATRSDALADPDLREFARSDVRLMVTRQPDQKGAIVSIYRRASRRGKGFLEDAMQNVDPTFLLGH